MATVDDHEITVFEFEQEYIEYLIRTGRNDTRNQRYRFLDEMIDNLAMADEAIDKGFLNNQIYKDAVWYQNRKSLADIYFVDQMNERLEPPTDDEIRKAYAKSKRKVYVRHLFSRNEDQLYKYYSKLQQGENFVDVANEFYNTQEYDSTAGYLGPVTYYGIDDNFAETAFSLNEGEFSKPIRSKFGYHIIYVEKVIRQAMLIESEYQVRKKGIENKLRERNQKLIGDSYVRDLMMKLDVQMNRAALVKVMEEIQNLPSIQNIEREEQGNVEAANWNSNRLKELSLEVNEQEVLGTYVLLGERHEFTVEDYLSWLPYLPLSESRTRTGASVGRAMSNEVLMQLSEANGYQDDDRIKEKVRNRGLEVLSELYQHELIQDAIQDTGEVSVPDNFKRQVLKNRSFRLETSYWKIPATSREDAQLIRRDVLNGTAPQSFPNYQLFEDVALSPSDSDYSLVDEVQTAKPAITMSNQKQWAVLNVIERKFVETSADSVTQDLEMVYRVYNYLDQKVDSIRSEAKVTINRELFDEIYEL